MFDNSVHLIFGFTRQEATELAKDLLKAAKEAQELESSYNLYLKLEVEKK